MKKLLYTFSGMLLIGGFYLLETIEWHKSWGKLLYVLPFGFQCEWWIARDFAYLLILLAFLIIVVTKDEAG